MVTGDIFEKKSPFSNPLLKNGQKKCPKMKRGFENQLFFWKMERMDSLFCLGIFSWALGDLCPPLCPNPG